MIDWVGEYFDSGYWSLADAEYDDARNATEVGYLAATFVAGARLLDAACGQGRHARPLARKGYQVVGVDIDERALERAQRLAEADGVTVEWRRGDLLGGSRSWAAGLPRFDGAYLIQAIGWGSDSDQLHVFRNMRELLEPDGILVVEMSNPYWIARHFAASATMEVSGVTFDFEREFDIVNGRNKGYLATTDSDHRETRRRHDFRLYTIPEVSRLLRESGFDVLRVDADYTSTRPSLDSRYLQLVAAARSPASAVISLASARGGTKDPGGDTIDLSVAGDEFSILATTLRDAASRAGLGVDMDLGLVTEYGLDDPDYSDLCATVRTTFAVPESVSVRFGAGTMDLLRKLADLARAGHVLQSSWGFPDYGAWAAAAGAVITRLDGQISRRDVHRIRPSVVVLDRPNLVGQYEDLDDIVTIGEACLDVGAVLVVDEASANYYPFAWSSAQLVPRMANLVVLRSLSKGYFASGLRFGLAMHSNELDHRLTEMISPLAISRLAYRTARELYGIGDVFESHRETLSRHGPVLADAIRGAGLDVVGAPTYAPWLVVDDPEGTGSAVFERSGIRVRELRSGVNCPRSAVRVSVPYEADRLTTVLERLRE
jgi:histidinol-phosphate/aromatic aminotransferase/cobyric acid decarboxylase-like protein/SAM-dependent methyltransferase